jgi:preprotein translocase subunit SecE
MKFFDYLKDTKAEMSHISWPTKKQAIAYTLVVIVVSVILSVYLGLLDLGFVKALDAIIR